WNSRRLGLDLDRVLVTAELSSARMRHAESWIDEDVLVCAVHSQESADYLLRVDSDSTHCLVEAVEEDSDAQRPPLPNRLAVRIRIGRRRSASSSPQFRGQSGEC